MPFTIQTGGVTIGCVALQITGVTVSISQGVGTVGPGPTYYPVSLGSSVLLTDSSGVAQPVGSFMWGQDHALVDGSGNVHLGAASGGSATALIGTLTALAIFDTGTVTNQGDGVIQVSFP